MSVLALTYAYVFLEWLFFVTKPSFLTARPWFERVIAFFAGAWPFVVTVLVIHIVVCICAWIAGRSGKWSATQVIILNVVPAAIIAATSLMLIDNFSYTMFRWGIVKTGIYTAPLYWLLFIGIFTIALRENPIYARLKLVIAATLLPISVVSLVWGAMGAGFAYENRVAAGANTALPNVIMFASDGVNANHTSAYGYGRRTTPNLDAWLSQSMVADNAFTNSGMTTGSLTSMMTGKYPATTKVFYPPQTLQGEDAYEHLPRILRKIGYKSLQETIGYYADAKDLNWLDSFNYANGRKLHWSRIDRLPLRLQAAAQFAERIRLRFQDRAEHLLFIKQMTDDYAGVVPEEEQVTHLISDNERMERVLDFIKSTRQPFFIHIHLMGTHCCKWHPKIKRFSADPAAGADEQQLALFDDAILESDRYFGEMMDLLEERKLLDNTVVIYSSDHVKEWGFRSQVPLIFIFPHGEHRGVVAAPVQLLDVAPTLLNYLNIKIPNWMEGRSIIGANLPKYRPIFVGYRARYLDAAAAHAEIGPPYYDLAKEALVVCNQWYILSLEDRSVTSGTIPAFRGTCAADKLPDQKAARDMMTKHLYERGVRF